MPVNHKDVWTDTEVGKEWLLKRLKIARDKLLLGSGPTHSFSLSTALEVLISLTEGSVADKSSFQEIWFTGMRGNGRATKEGAVGMHLSKNRIEIASGTYVRTDLPVTWLGNEVPTSQGRGRGQDSRHRTWLVIGR